MGTLTGWMFRNWKNAFVMEEKQGIVIHIPMTQDYVENVSQHAQKWKQNFQKISAKGLNFLDYKKTKWE